MVSEEIITGLKNAIEHGDSLANAVQIMINSGYNSAEVQEASKYLGGSTMHEALPEEHLTMPNQKSRMPFMRKPQQNLQNIPSQKPPQQIFTQYNNQINQDSMQSMQQYQNKTDNPISPTQNQMPPIQNPQNQVQPPEPYSPSPSFQTSSLKKGSLTKELESMGPAKPGHTKEIILLLVLLSLIGILTVTIIFREKILGLFGI